MNYKLNIMSGLISKLDIGCKIIQSGVLHFFCSPTDTIWSFLIFLLRRPGFENR